MHGQIYAIEPDILLQPEGCPWRCMAQRVSLWASLHQNTICASQQSRKREMNHGRDRSLLTTVHERRRSRVGRASESKPSDTGSRGVVIISAMVKVVNYPVDTRVLHIRDNSDMEPVSAGDAPTDSEDETSPDARHEVCSDDLDCAYCFLTDQKPTIKVAGWTCVRVRSAVFTTPRHDPPDTEERDDYHEDRKDEDEEHNSAMSQTIICTGICEWEGCDQILRGPDAPALLYVSSSVSLYTILQI